MSPGLLVSDSPSLSLVSVHILINGISHVLQINESHLDKLRITQCSQRPLLGHVIEFKYLSRLHLANNQGMKISHNQVVAFGSQ